MNVRMNVLNVLKKSRMNVIKHILWIKRFNIALFLIILCSFSLGLNSSFAAAKSQTSKSQAKVKGKSNASSDKIPNNFGDRREVQVFIWNMHTQYGFDVQKLKTLFRSYAPDPKVIQAISKPYEAVSWDKYRERFVNDTRAKAGVQFWKQNADVLKRAQAEYGIPPEIIVAIIGVETYYGQITGNFPVVQALATLAFDYPPRANFFKKELEQFLLLTRDENLDPKTIYGSYAGAMGTPQFIPSSYRQYAVDFTGSGTRDLINNVPDAIGSVANYFKMHGWQTGNPVAYPANAYGSEFERLASTNQKDPKPKLTLGEYAQFNILPKDKEALNANKNLPANFMILNSDSDNPEPWLTLQNFYVITRYNHSVNYAMAVFQLSQRIRELYSKQ